MHRPASFTYRKNGGAVNLYRQKSSQDRMLNRIEQKFGRDCVIFYGDWLRKDQMRCCNLSPMIGIDLK